MKEKKRNIIQLLISTLVIINCLVYGLYINDIINFKLISIGELNPYGGWSEFRLLFTDVSYRFRGISKGIALTIAIGLVSLLLGRFFCGFICPIGSLQDFSRYIGKKLGIKSLRFPKGKHLKGEMLKYLILIILLVLSILGLGNLIAPYSPWTAYLNLLMGFNIQIGLVILIAILILSLFIKRVFCRFFCPLGAFQSLLYAIGPLKVNTNKDCNGCTNCLRDCPVDIEESHDGIISPECINCLKCTEKQCIKGTSGYSVKFAGKKSNNNIYILASLILFISIYLFLPLVGFQRPMQSIGDLANMEDGIYTGIGTGFGGNIRVEVTINENEIIGIKTLEHRETSGYYQEVYKSVSRDIIESQNLNVDGISGATSTSRGFINAVKSGLGQSLIKNKR